MLATCASIILSFQLSIFNCAQAQYTVTHLERPYNTTGSETGAIRVGDTILAFSTMPPERGGNKMFNYNSAQMQVYQARIARNGKLARPKPSRWGLNTKRDHTGNLALDPYTNDLYFTRCRVGDPDLRCEIWWARKLRRGWSKPQRLRGHVNVDSHTATHPAVARLADSTVILYFVSDRPGGVGGMDIWYTLVRNGVAGECVNLGPQVNSPDDDITPHYDQRNGVLYFSSNRADSYFLNDSMCCNDIYLWQLDSTLLPARDTVVAIDTTTPNSELTTHNSELITHNSFMFPLFLYFHNDEPDPMSRRGTTEATYTDCQRRYAQLRGEYLGHQANADDSAMMQLFFDTCVVGNYQRVEALFDYVEEQLDEGRSVVLTVAGYASPVFHNDYNQLLSERRIASFVNMLRAWRGGMFADAMDDGRLILRQQPRGVDQLSTLNSQLSTSKDPVYSLPAAMARRIEILSCEVK